MKESNRKWEESVKRERHQVASNDPSLTNLSISNWYEFDDWETFGVLVGRNTHIEELDFSDGIKVDDMEIFFSGVASNRSIKSLSLNNIHDFGCGEHEGELFNILIPFFQGNNNLECLEIKSGGDLFHRAGGHLCRALRSFGSLKRFDNSGWEMVDYDAMVEIIRALDGHSGLNSLDLSGSTIGTEASGVLKTLLGKSNSILSALSLSGCDMDDDTALTLAEGLAGKAMKALDLSSNESITEIGWRAVFAALRDCGLEKLALRQGSFNDAVANSLLTVLTTNPVKSLDLENMIDITNTAWQALCNHFGTSPMIEELHLHNNALGGDSMAIILGNSLAGNTSLRKLSLHTNVSVTADGWDHFPALLQNPNSSLMEIDLRLNGLDDENMQSFAQALVGNSTLKYLFVDKNRAITEDGYDAFVPLLCNASSVNAIHQSNHTLERILMRSVSEGSYLYEDGAELFRINREFTLHQAIRRKVIIGLRENVVSQPFVGMDLNVLPHAISPFASDGDVGEVRGGLYGIIRNRVSDLFSVDDKTKKRKRNE